MLTVRVMISEHPISFRRTKVKSVKTGPSFVGMMRLVTALSEGKKDYTLEINMEHVIIWMRSHN